MAQKLADFLSRPGTTITTSGEGARHYLVIGKLSLRGAEEVRRRVAAGEDSIRATAEVLEAEGKAIGSAVKTT